MSERLTVREPASAGGFVDAAWWPSSDDLVAELPPLLARYREAGRAIVHVVYNIDAWQPVPKRAIIDGHKVKLGGFRTGDPNIVGLVDGAGRPTIQVMVVPPATEPDVAKRALELAATADSTDRPTEMMEHARSAS